MQSWQFSIEGVNMHPTNPGKLRNVEDFYEGLPEIDFRAFKEKNLAMMESLGSELELYPDHSILPFSGTHFEGEWQMVETKFGEREKEVELIAKQAIQLHERGQSENLDTLIEHEETLEVFTGKLQARIDRMNLEETPEGEIETIERLQKTRNGTSERVHSLYMAKSERTDSELIKTLEHLKERAKLSAAETKRNIERIRKMQNEEHKQQKFELERAKQIREIQILEQETIERWKKKKEKLERKIATAEEGIKTKDEDMRRKMEAEALKLRQKEAQLNKQIEDERAKLRAKRQAAEKIFKG